MCKVKDLGELDRILVIETNDGGKYTSKPYNLSQSASNIVKDFLDSSSVSESDISSIYTARVDIEPDTVYVSEHAFDRMKERNGWGRQTALRMIKKIYDNGKRPEELSGYIRKYIHKKEKGRSYGNNYIFYGDMLYVFDRKILVTVYKIPNKSSQIKKNYDKILYKEDYALMREYA